MQLNNYMSYHYCWNQPKKYGKYDLYLDGKIKADDFEYKIKNQNGQTESVSMSQLFDDIEEKLKTHFTFDSTYGTITELNQALENGELKETVIYIVNNQDGSDDSYNEYMVVTVKDKDGNTLSQTLELIGSGSYAQQKAELFKQVDDRIADVNAERQRAIAKESQIDAALAKRIPYSLHKNVNVVGNVKDVVKLDVPQSSNEAMYCPQGLIMGGDASAAGLVTRGICGIGITDANVGACEKQNLYVNYDGNKDTTYKVNRQLILQAYQEGTHYGHNLYEFAAARGDAVKGFVEEKIMEESDRAKAVQNDFEERISTMEGLNLMNIINQLQNQISELKDVVDSLKRYHQNDGDDSSQTQSDGGDEIEPTEPSPQPENPENE